LNASTILIAFFFNLKPEGEDELKKKQLMELAIINGTYRDGNKLIQQKLNQILIPGGAAGNAYAAAAAAMQQAVNQQNAANTLRSPPNHIGQPLIISPRLTPHMSGGNQSGHQVNTNLLNGSQLLTTGDPNSLYYTTIPTANLQAFYPTADGGFQTLDYPGSIDLSQAGTFLSLSPIFFFV
jgi:protein quaking